MIRPARSLLSLVTIIFLDPCTLPTPILQPGFYQFFILQFTKPKDSAMKQKTIYDPDRLLTAVDLLATFLFAMEGAASAIVGNLDFFGVMVLSFSTALGGGILRDLLIGATPPASLRGSLYAVVAFLGGGVTFFLHHVVRQIPPDVMMILDAAGLGLFAVAGATKALEYKIPPLIAVLMGVITATGGGTIRCMFLAQVPAILRVDIYAVAALAGAAVAVAGIRKGLSEPWMMTIGAVVCFLLRIISVWRHWNLPTAP
jgi:uncharacterized membrane protein YeiH